MGLIVDSSVVIKAERRGDSEAQLLRQILALTAEQQVGLTSVGVTELLHGIYRAESPSRSERRRIFLEQLITDLPIYDYTLEAARLAARIDAEQRSKGTVIPFADLLIGATALSLGFSVVTENIRHFMLIPGLKVIGW